MKHWSIGIVEVDKVFSNNCSVFTDRSAYPHKYITFQITYLSNSRFTSVLNNTIDILKKQIFNKKIIRKNARNDTAKYFSNVKSFANEMLFSFNEGGFWQ